MTFQLFGIDFYWIEKIFSFWFCSLKIETESNEWHRCLFGINYNEVEIDIDLFWLRICTFYI